MVDIHCHVIPKIDDGARSEEMALRMLSEAVDDGIKDIIATPHFIRGRYELSYEDVKEQVRILNEICINLKINLKIHEGQEILLHKNIFDDYNEGLIGGLNDSNYYLFELDPMRFEKFIPDILYELSLKGIRPIIAHPERYRYIINDISKLNILIREGCLFQLNIGSIQGVYGRKIKACAQELLDREIYDFIGSDAHGVNIRKPILRKTIVEQSKKNMAKMLDLTENNQSLLHGEFVYNHKKIISVRRKISYFSRVKL